MKELNLTLVTYEQAKKLAEIGFPQLEDEKWYSTYLTNEPEVIDYESKYPYVCAPSLELAAKWLREEHKIMFDMTYEKHCAHSWCCDISTRNANLMGHYHFPKTVINYGTGYSDFNTYEKALSAGIDDALEMLSESRN